MFTDGFLIVSRAHAVGCQSQSLGDAIPLAFIGGLAAQVSLHLPGDLGH